MSTDSKRATIGSIAVAALLLSLFTVLTAHGGDAVGATADAAQPIVSYTFDDDSGTTVHDTSGHGNDGTWSGTPSYVPGVSGSAMQATKGTNVVTLPASVKPGATGVSVEFWYYETGVSGGGAQGSIFGNQDFVAGSNTGSTWGGLLLYNAANTTNLDALIGGNSARLTNLGDIGGTWVYLSAVVDSTAKTLKVYENGVQVGSTLTYTTTNPLDSGFPFRIGTDGSGVALTGTYPNSYANGYFDDFNLYDQPITSAQIANDYAATETVKPIVSYTFDDDSGTTVHDTSGHGNDGTWSGTPSYVPGVSGSAMQATKGTNVVTLPASVKPGATGVSVEFWYYETAINTGQGSIFGNQDFVSGSNTGPTWGGLLLYNLSGTPALSALIGGNSARLTNLDSNIIGRWIYISAVVDSTAKTLKVYENGVQVGSTLTYTTTNPLDSGFPFRIGTDGSGVALTGTYPGSYANGYFDDFNLYDQPITSAQIANDYAATGPQAITVTSGGHGTASADRQAAPGDTVSLSATPDPGYHLGGWRVLSPSGLTVSSDNTFVMPASAVSIQADFVPNTYTVHFDGNGADGGATADQQFTYDQATPLTANGFTLGGAGFAGWSTSPTGPVVYADGQSVTNLAATDGASVTLYARWRGAGQYLVSLGGDPNGTATASTDSAAPGDAVTLTAAPNVGYHLAGWQVSPASVTVSSGGTFTMPAADVTLTPQFAPNTYTVRYSGNGATVGATADSSLTYGQPAALTPNGFVRNDYLFAGWSTTPDGPVAYDDMATVTNLTAVQGATVTLYAQWTAQSVRPGSWPSLRSGFVTFTFKTPDVKTGAAVSQPLLGLWNGAAPTSYTKLSGASWLSVTADGTVTGIAPATVPQRPAQIAVTATNGSVASTILVQIPVESLHASPQIRTASWNAWDDGQHVTDAVGKNVAAIAAEGIGVVGYQSGGYRMAQAVATALGWRARGVGDLGIVSAYPFTRAPQVLPTTAAPATAATVSVYGDAVRLWDVHLDESGYGPYNACFNGVTDSAALVSQERSTTRFAQARTVAMEMAADRHGSDPVIMLGDLASPSAADWTQATSSSHCGAGAVRWPVPEVFNQAGLTDSFRAVNPDPLADPGNTWSPIVSTNANGQPEPQDRVDYVDYTRGGLYAVASRTLTVGTPSVSKVTGNAWASDHAAVVTTFSVGGLSTGPTPPPPPTVTVTRTTTVYQTGQGAASGSAFLAAVGARVEQGDGALAVDLSQVDFSTPGWYVALVTASKNGVVSDPVDVSVDVTS